MFKKLLSTLLILGGMAFGQSQFSGGAGVKVTGAFTVGDCAQILSRTSIGSAGAACGSGGPIVGTANQITNTSGTLSIPSTFIAPGTIQATTSLAGTSLRLNGATNGASTFTPAAIAGTSTNGVTASNVLLLPDGALATPSFAFAASPSTGMWEQAAGDIIFSSAGVGAMRLVSNFAGFPSNEIFFWTSGTVTGAADTGMSRTAAGVIGVGNGNGGDITGTLSTGKTIINAAGSASTSPLSMIGNILTGGSGTTNFPHFYINNGTAPTTWNTSGTYLGINGITGFAGNFVDFRVNGGGSLFSITAGGAVAANSSFSGTKYNTATNCSAAGTSASPSVVSCSSASAGAFSCATNASGATCTVNTTAAVTNSDIQVSSTASAGTRLSVTCNTTADVPTAPRIASISTGVSFTVNLGTFTTNPECFFYTINN